MNVKLTTAGRLAAAALLGAALLTPSAVFAQTGTQENVSSENQVPNCTGGPGGSDITPGEGQIAWLFVHADTDATSGTLTAEFDVAGTKTADSYIQGGIKYLIVTDRPETLISFSDTIVGGQLVLSHVCYGPEVTPTPEVTPEVTPTPDATGTPQSESTPTPPVVTPTPTGTVLAETGRPRVTPPSTDSGVGASSGTGGGLPIVLVALAGILAASLVLLPRRRTNR